VQWETILRSVSAHRAYHWLNKGSINAKSIAEFLLLDRRLPRSLLFCYTKIVDSLGFIAADYGVRHPSHDQAEGLRARLTEHTIDTIFDQGLHEFIEAFVRVNNQLGRQIEQDYRFSE
jgi:uncharacterized alpha-E superfamily protein